MKMKNHDLKLILFLLFGLSGRLAGQQETGLKNTFMANFPVGVSVSPANVSGSDTVLILREFNSITAENVMKMELIHPEENRFSWERADLLVDFASRHGLKMRGHALCWHQQVGEWMFLDPEGGRASKALLLTRLEAHIRKVVERYKKNIYTWDVVNEAISDSKDEFLRNSDWYKIAGPDFIIKAFQFAHEADPDAILFYNDYNAVIPEKRDRIIRLLKMLKDQNVPIGGMGIQGHWNIYHPSEEELRDALDAYSTLGLQLQITELDVSVYPWEKNTRARQSGESDELTPALAEKQKAQYEMIFRVLHDYREHITGITFWNVTDKDSWLNSYPVPGRRNYPLLFDREGNRKPVYDSVVKTWSE